LDEDTTKVVPWKLQQEITKRLKAKWWEDKTRMQQRQVIDPCWTKDAMQRTRDSYFRAMVHGFFGGVEWLYCLVALGQVPIPMIQWIGESRDPKNGPAPVPKAKPVRKTGVQHKTSDPKQMREDAKRKERQLTQINTEWRLGRSKVTWEDWNKLKAEVEAISA
jgi:hypothetical protein